MCGSYIPVAKKVTPYAHAHIKDGRGRMLAKANLLV